MLCIVGTAVPVFRIRPRAIEVTGFAVGAYIQCVERGATGGQCFGKHRPEMFNELLNLGRADGVRGVFSVYVCSPQRLVGVDVADTRYQRLVQECAFELASAHTQGQRELFDIEAWIEHVGRDVRDVFGAVVAVRTDEHFTEGALIDEP